MIDVAMDNEYHVTIYCRWLLRTSTTGERPTGIPRSIKLYSVGGDWSGDIKLDTVCFRVSSLLMPFPYLRLFPLKAARIQLNERWYRYLPNTTGFESRRYQV